jgi:hypothetical protein
MRRALGRQHGGIVIGWLIKILLSLAVLGFVVFEAGAVIVAKVTADRVAIDAADEAGQVYESTGSSAKAQEAAKHIAARDQADLIRFRLLYDGKFVEVTVRKRASSVLVQRIGFLRKFSTAEATHSGQVR